MYCYNWDITFIELPDEICITFAIPGCGGPCRDCHSNFLHEIGSSPILKQVDFIKILDRYKNQATAVVFLGGEWFEDLVDFLIIAKDMKYKTVLYTSKRLEDIDKNILNNLDYIKIGRFDIDLGGLESANTNQRMLNLKTKEDITYKFKK